jgi:hypothetical protein
VHPLIFQQDSESEAHPIQTSRSALLDCSERSESALTKPSGPAEAHKKAKENNNEKASENLCGTLGGW